MKYHENNLSRRLGDFMAPKKPCRKKEFAFSLIELLVVIAIISLLMTILLPSLEQAKRLAKRVACMANQRGYIQALSIYASDNEGWYPGGRAWSSGLHTTSDGADMLRDYLSVNAYPSLDMRFCPGTDQNFIDFSTTKNYWDTRLIGSYRVIAGSGDYANANAYVFFGWVLYSNAAPTTKDSPYGTPCARMEHAGDFVSNYSPSGFPDGHGSVYVRPPSEQPALMDASSPFSSQWTWWGAFSFANPHEEGENITFIDGHSEFRQNGDIQTYFAMYYGLNAEPWW